MSLLGALNVDVNCPYSVFCVWTLLSPLWKFRRTRTGAAVGRSKLEKCLALAVSE